MEKDKQRSQKTKRRERAQRMQAEKRQTQNKTKDCDSAEDEPMKEKPKRPPPPNRRKKTNNSSSSNCRNNHSNDTNSSNNANVVSSSKENIYEEDIIDGFAIFSFTSYDDLENSLKQLKCGQVTLGIPTDGTKLPAKTTTPELTPPPAVLNNHIVKSPVQSNQIRNNISSPLIDHAKKATAVSSKNAAEGSTAVVSPANRSKTPVPSSMSAVPVTPPDPVIENACTRNTTDSARDKPVAQQTSSPLRDQRASSHDRLSDISSRCSSGKGYMCDSEGDEGDDDKGSDGDCMLFPSPPSSCKRELPRTGIPNHLNSNNLLNGNATDASERRSPAGYAPPSSKPQIRVVTPPLKYSPKTIQQLSSPIGQPPSNSLPYPSSLAQPNHKSNAAQTGQPDQRNVAGVLPSHHYGAPVSQTQSQSPYTPSQQSLPLTHQQYSATPPHYPPVINGGLPPAPPQAHSGGHTAGHLSHPMYPAHHMMTGTASPLSTASVPNALPTTTVPQLSPSPAIPPYATSSAPSNASSSYATPPQQCPLQLSVTSTFSPQPPAAHSANPYAPPYVSSHSQPTPHMPYSTQATSTPPNLQPSSASQTSFAAHSAAHLSNSHHTMPSPHHPSPGPHHMSASPHHHNHQQAPPHLPPQMSSYNHVSQMQPAIYSNLPYRSTANSSVTSENSTVVVAAPSSFATTPHTSANSFSSLYAPYSNTPYLPSHSRASRSPLPVISAKSTVNNISASITTSSMSIPPSPVPASVATTTVTTSHRDYATTPTVNRSHSPRGHSPTRERDSYSSNVSSLSRGSVQTPISNSSPFNMPSVSAPAPPAHATMPVSVPVPPSVPVSSSLNLSNKPSVWGPVGNSTTTSSSAVSTTISRSHNSFAAPLFTAPTTSTPTHGNVAAPPTVPSLHSAPTHPSANPFSAESLFQSKADLLRRELDSRFLATQERSLVAAGAAPPPYLRTEMHHHQHQHTHVHQHTASLLPPPPAAALYPPPLQFKDIPKLGSVDSPFYRQTLGIANYPGYPSTLLHPTLGAATPFAPPTHLPTFTPKQVMDPTKPKLLKTGKWNAMHVRIAWEIYHHQQQKQPAADIKPSKNELLNRTPSHLFQTPPRADLSPYSTPHRPSGNAFEAHAHPAASPYAALGNSMFSRYPPAPFPSLTQYPPALHDPWARLQAARAMPNLGNTGPYPSPIPPAWNIKPEPNESERERERERERDREREREKEKERSKERDRMRREEKQRRLIAQQQQAAAAQAAQQTQAAKTVLRERSPLRDTPSAMASKEEEVMLLGRPPPAYLPRHAARTLPPPPPQFTPWEHYRYDPLRFNPLMAAFREDEEQRAKLFAAYPAAPPPGAHFRKEAAPGPMHGRSDLHLKKDDSSQSR